MVLAGFLAIICGGVGSTLLNHRTYWGESGLAFLTLPLLPVAVFLLLMASVVASSRWKNAKWSGRIYVGALLALIVSGLMSGHENRYAWAVLGTGITAAVFFWHSLWLDNFHVAQNSADK